MNGRLCLGQGGSHLLKQRDELEQSGFQQRVCERPDKSHCIHSICKPLQLGRKWAINTFPRRHTRTHQWKLNPSYNRGGRVKGSAASSPPPVSHLIYKPHSDKSVQAVGTARLVLPSASCQPAFIHPPCPPHRPPWSSLHAVAFPVYISYKFLSLLYRKWAPSRSHVAFPLLDRRRIREATTPKPHRKHERRVSDALIPMCRYFKAVQL